MKHNLIITGRVKPTQVIMAILNEFSCVTNKQGIEWVNYGGCGIFAEYLYTTLCNLGLSPSIAIVCRDAKSTEHVLKNNGTAHDIRWQHILVYVENLYIDSTGIKANPVSDMKQYPDVVSGMSIDLLKDWNSRPEYWNGTFDRRNSGGIAKGFKELEKKVTKYLQMSF